MSWQYGNKNSVDVKRLKRRWSLSNYRDICSYLGRYPSEEITGFWQAVYHEKNPNIHPLKEIKRCT